MDCHELERLLERLLEGKLTEEQRAACLEHAAGCDACGELLEAVPLDGARGGDTDVPELAVAVLAATIGSPCKRSRELLCDFVDAELVEPERELVALHLVSCARCRGLAGAIETMKHDLPRLAEERPDSRFVRDVLAASLPRRIRLRRWWAETWPRWVRRPRFAVEAAYVAALVVALIFGAPGEPLAAMPKRALEIAQVETATRWSQVVDHVETLAAATRGGASDWLDRSGAQATQVLESARGTYLRGLAVARTYWEALASLLVEGEDETPPTAETEQTEEKP